MTFAAKSDQCGIMMHHQSFIFGKAHIQLKHMQDTLMLSKDLQSVLWSLPGSSSVSDTKYFIRLYKVVKRLICVSHPLMKDIRKDQKDCGD